MDDLSLQELEQVAEAYERLLAPALFQAWTGRLADAANIGAGQQVLDVACGTGILARTLAERVGENGSVSGLDINPGMLAVARRSSPAIDWRQGPAEALPYASDTFDAVASQFGLMLFADPEAALREMRRVLKPGGSLSVAVFDAIDHFPPYAAMADVYERVVGSDVGNALRFPFSMGDRHRLAALFASAGIDSARITEQEGMASFPSVRGMVLADVKGWFPFAGIQLDDRTIDAVVCEAETALGPFRTDAGAVAFRVPVQLVAATKA